MRAVCRGERPPRPESPHLNDDAWRLINQCWSQKKQTRPDMKDVVKTMESWKGMVPLFPMRRVPSPFVPQGELRQDIRRPSTLKDTVKRMISWKTHQLSPPAPIATPPNLEAVQGVSSMPSTVSTSVCLFCLF